MEGREMKSTLTKHQKRTYEKYYTEDKVKFKIVVTIRYDDECHNGHNSFAITGDIKEDVTGTGCYRDYTGGCIYEEIAKHFPGLKKYIKWHLVSSDEPIHYIANTVYHASDKDYNGLRKGETRQIKNGKTGKLCWILKDFKNIHKYIDRNKKPIPLNLKVEYEPLNNVGKGKKADLQAARNSAVWPNATLKQLGDKKALMKRLPELMNEFKKDVEELGFIF